MNLLLMTVSNNSHHVYISKILIELCTLRQNIEIKNTFADIIFNVLVNRKY